MEGGAVSPSKLRHSSRDKAPEHLLDEFALVLRSGGLILAPTETSYMLAGRADDAGVLRRIAALKGRPADKPFPVIIGRIEQAWANLEWTPSAQRLAEVFWPGPLTLVMPRKQGCWAGLGGGDGSVALRIPGLSLTRALARAVDFPLVSTSANLSGEAPCYEVQGLLESAPRLAEAVSLVWDCGELPYVPASTIVRFADREPLILREGPVSEAEIRKALCLG